jgi:hypothetical protein
LDVVSDDCLELGLADDNRRIRDGDGGRADFGLLQSAEVADARQRDDKRR